MSAIKFGGARVANRSVVDVCNYDENKMYVMLHNGCEWEVVPLDDALKTLDSYVETTPQTLTHDGGGNLQRA